MILVDTNVISRLCDNGDPLYSSAENSLRKLRTPTSQTMIVPQVLYEFWVVATRPSSQNGLNMTAERALLWMSYFKRTCQLFPEPPGLISEWESILQVYKPLGKPAHDARLFAAMRLLGVSTILTFNAGDFARYGVTILDPRHV